MSGLSQILETARRALNSQRAGMNVTSHNIANASTEGYSRQRVEFQATPPEKTPLGLLGTGVTTEHIGRVRERFIDQQIRGANDTLGESSSQQSILGQVEAVVNEPSDAGLSGAFTKFFNAFQSLSLHPEESSTRNEVLQQGVQLTQAFQRLSKSLSQLKSDLLNDVNTKIDRVNQLTKEISDLDVQITAITTSGYDPSDAKDQLDLKLDELSKIVPIKVAEDQRGSVMVSVGGTMVASRAGSVSLKSLASGTTVKVVGEVSGKDVTVGSGELGGILKSYNTTIPGYQSKLNQIAAALISRVNTLHAAGYGLGTPPPTGNNFFAGTDATDIKVDPAVTSNISNIAASADGSAGNNGVATAIAHVESEALLNGNTTSIPQAYRGLVSEIGSDITSSDNIAKAQQLVLTQLENQRSAVSGVSIDEEMTNLIKFQRSFDAAARIVTTANEMFQTILDLVR
ncbi:MAG: flagellar hook-associated protein FlgK [Ignavibacteriales bacterium]|nr:flagellar hook-associated protein FlgK [Ignavibacteriales bacterium]